MNQQQYIAQNLKGFEGDESLANLFKALIDKHDIKLCIETGTFYGSTTRRLASMVERVMTIEVKEESFKKALDYTADSDINNIFFYLGNSAQVLPTLLDGEQGKVLFFLDAHWQEYNPLLDELAVIAQAKNIIPIIAIHDFKNPHHPEYGFDSYAGQDYEWSWIEESVKKIYGYNYRVSYNTDAIGAKRGVIFIEPVLSFPN